jgi:hypothetical protein
MSVQNVDQKTGVGGWDQSEWILQTLAWRGGGVDSVSSEQEQVAGSCEYGDKPSGSGATELIGWLVTPVLFLNCFLFQISTRLIHM